MTNPTSTSRASRWAGTTSNRARGRRRGIARALPVGTCLAACLMLAAAAAVDGQAAALVLAAWVGLLIVAGMKMTVPRRTRSPRRPVLVLAEFDDDGELGDARPLPLVRTRAAQAVLRSRPRG
jgi:hypothetical protein